MKKTNFNFLKEFFKDPAILSWDAVESIDLTKKVRNVFYKLKNNPEKITEQDIREVVWDKDSQIGLKDPYWTHITNTMIIYSQLTEKLLSQDSNLDLPDPKIARTRGLVHDFSATFEKYGEENGKPFGQHGKETTWFALATALGLEDIEKHVAMHHTYFGLLDMIANGELYPELYKGWKEVLNDDNHQLSLRRIKSFFEQYIAGKDNFPLVVLSVSDCLTPPELIDQNKLFEGLKTLTEFRTAWKSRNEDIAYRYYYSKIEQNKKPTPLGVVLVERGDQQRLNMYSKIVEDLLFSKEKIAEYKETHPKLWKY